MSDSESMKDLARLLKAIQAGAQVDPTLTTRIREQCRTVAATPQEAEDMAFIAAIGYWPPDDPEPHR